MRVQLDEQCLINANSQFWEQMLAMTLDPMRSSGEFFADAGHLLASIALSGAWTGCIEVRMAAALARQATAAMMMQPVDSLAEADVLDATREIANMIAGLIKSSLPRPCSMSVPESAVAPGEFQSLPPAQDVLVVAFRHAAGNMIVRVGEWDPLA